MTERKMTDRKTIPPQQPKTVKAECFGHAEKVQIVTETMPSEETFAVVAARFKLLGEVSRLKILAALKAGELCVDHIAEATGAQQSATSHQLRLLRDNGFVKARRVGKSVLYRLADRHVAELMTMGFAHADCEEDV